MAYIGTSPSNGVRRVHTYTATASQTTFSGASSEGVTLSYADTNYLDVYQNGILLGSADYTATSGTSVVLTQTASADDLVVIVVYDVFSVADTVSKANGGTFDSGITIDEDGATVLTVDRATSDGDIIDLQKNGTTVGSIGTLASKLTIGSSGTGVRFNYAGIDAIVPWNVSTNALTDGATSLGYSSTRFNNLYLSGGVYLGGTGSSNYLQDYETGSWTVAVQDSSGNAATSIDGNGRYVKIGTLVTVVGRFNNPDLTGLTASGDLRVYGLPFSSSAFTGSSLFYTGASPRMEYVTWDTTLSTNITTTIGEQVAYLRFNESRSGNLDDHLTVSQFTSNSDVWFSITYTTSTF